MKRSLAIAMLVLATLLHAAAASGAGPALRTFGVDSFQSIVQDHRGQPFVIMLWSLDCEYCLASFQTLEQARRKSGLQVVTIATDPAGDAAADAQLVGQVNEKVRASGLRAQTWAFGADSPERLRHAIDPKWRGELPRSYWFDRQGRMSAHSGPVTPQIVQHFSSLQ